MLVKDIIKAKYGVAEAIDPNTILLALYRLIPLLVKKNKKTLSVFVITEESLKTVTNVYLPVFVYNKKTGLTYSFLTEEEYHRSQNSTGIFSRNTFNNVFTLNSDSDIVLPSTSDDFVIRYIPSMESHIFVWEDDVFNKKIDATSTILTHNINPALASVYMYMLAFISLQEITETIKSDSTSLTSSITSTLANIITEFNNISDSDINTAYDTCLSSWSEIKLLIDSLLSKTDSSIAIANTRLASDDVEIASGYNNLLSTTSMIDAKKTEGYLSEIMQYINIFNNAIQAFSAFASKASMKFTPIVNLLGVRVQELANKLQTLPVYQNNIQVILKDVEEEIEVLP